MFDGETTNQSHLIRVWLPGAQVEILGGPGVPLSLRGALRTYWISDLPLLYREFPLFDY